MAGPLADSKVELTAAMKADSMVARKADSKAAWKEMRSVAMRVDC